MRGAGVEENGAASGARLWVNSLGALALDGEDWGVLRGGARITSHSSMAGFFKFCSPLPGCGRVHGFRLALLDE